MLRPQDGSPRQKRLGAITQRSDREWGSREADRREPQRHQVTKFFFVSSCLGGPNPRTLLFKRRHVLRPRDGSPRQKRLGAITQRSDREWSSREADRREPQRHQVTKFFFVSSCLGGPNSRSLPFKRRHVLRPRGRSPRQKRPGAITQRSDREWGSREADRREPQRHQVTKFFFVSSCLGGPNPRTLLFKRRHVLRPRDGSPRQKRLGAITQRSDREWSSREADRREPQRHQVTKFFFVSSCLGGPNSRSLPFKRRHVLRPRDRSPRQKRPGAITQRSDREWSSREADRREPQRHQVTKFFFVSWWSRSPVSPVQETSCASSPRLRSYSNFFFLRFGSRDR